MKSTTQKKQKSISFTRRMFLQISLWFSAAVSSWGILKFLSYAPPHEVLLSSITLGDPLSYALGTGTYIPEVKAWLMHDESGLFAVTSICTHLGCTVNHENEKFVCPCHGSQFTISGEVLQGPAVKALEHYQVSLSANGLVVIDRDKVVSANERLKI